MISIQLLGGASLRSGDTVITGPPAQRHRIALLALLVDAAPQPLARDRALALLWPERDEAGARRLLNLAVHVLRGALGEAVIASVGDALLFNPAGVQCDLHELQQAIASDDADRIARLHAGPLLDGFHLPEAVEFGHWLDERRRELGEAYVRALLATAARQELAGDHRARVATCRRLVAADPHSADHARRLMHALDAAGDRPGAIHHAAEYARRLRTDLDLEPDPAVAALAEQLRRGPSRPRDLPSVAVLPFADLSGDPAHGYFVDGVTEDVIAHLSKIRGLKVISRTSVMQFRERRKPLREIARELGAATVVEGSVRHAGDRVRIVATLVDAETDRQVWAETYDRQVTDIFAIQTDVALRIAGALKAELTPDERARVAQGSTDNLQAYRLYLQGVRWFMQYTPEALERAKDYLTQAIAVDPRFAMAYTLLSMTYIEMAEHATAATAPLHRAALDAVERALELDPGLGDAHATAGYLRLVVDFDWQAAEQGIRRGIELNPGSSYGYDMLSRLCWSVERYDEAEALGRQAQELDPLAHRIDLATMMLRARRFHEARAIAEDAVELDGSVSRTRATLGWAYFFCGRPEDGIAQLERAVELSSRYALWLAQLGEMYGLAGRTGDARAILGELQERATRTFVSPYHLAYVYTGLGETDRAFDLLEQAVAERTGVPYSLKGSSLFAPLRSHPRFGNLMRMLNLQ